MSTAQEQQQQKHREEDLSEALGALIAEQVVHALGQPEGLYKVRVHPLWGNYFRVNVLIGLDAASLRVANSYFLKADGDGNIVESTPRITSGY